MKNLCQYYQRCATILVLVLIISSCFANERDKIDQCPAIRAQAVFNDLLAAKTVKEIEEVVNVAKGTLAWNSKEVLLAGLIKGLRIGDALETDVRSPSETHNLNTLSGRCSFALEQMMDISLKTSGYPEAFPYKDARSVAERHFYREKCKRNGLLEPSIESLPLQNKIKLAQSTSTDPVILRTLCFDDNETVRKHVAENVNAPYDAVSFLYSQGNDAASTRVKAHIEPKSHKAAMNLVHSTNDEEMKDEVELIKKEFPEEGLLIIINELLERSRLVSKSEILKEDFSIKDVSFLKETKAQKIRSLRALQMLLGIMVADVKQIENPVFYNEAWKNVRKKVFLMELTFKNQVDGAIFSLPRDTQLQWAGDPDTGRSNLRTLALINNETVHTHLSSNPSTPIDVINFLMDTADSEAIRNNLAEMMKRAHTLATDYDVLNLKPNKE